MIKKLLLLFAFLASLMADQSVSVTASINRGDYADKDLQKLQHILLDKAKLEAASQLFGDFIKSETTVKDGSLLRDLILAEKGGIVHIQGNPQYGNGKNLGELQVSITAYATQQDIEDMKVHRIELNNFIYSDKTLTLAQLKTQADNAFVIEAIGQKRPSIKTAPNAAELAKKLALSVHIEQKDFNPDWLAYKMSGYVEYIPLFLRNESGEDAKQVIAKFGLKKNTANISIYGTDTNYQGNLNHNGKGFIIAKEINKILDKNLKAGGDQPKIVLSAKLLVPDSIKGDNVTIYLNGSKLAHNEYLYINSERMEKYKIDAKVIHNGNERYIDLAYVCNTQYQFQINDSLSNLNKMNFTVSEEGNAKKFSAPICTMQTLKRSSDSLFEANIVINGNDEDLTTHISNSGNGFQVTQNILKVLERNSKMGDQRITLSAKLLVPDSIKGDNVTIHLNGSKLAHNEALYINSERMEKYKIDAKVIHNGNERYINVAYDGYIQYHFQISDSFSNLNRMNLVIEEEKLYPLVSSIGDQTHQISLINNNRSDTYQLSATARDTGIFLTPQSIKQIEKNKGYQTVSLSAKLLVPDSIKDDSVTVHLNGSRHTTYQSIAINGKKMEGYKIDTNIINNGNERYISLTLNCTSEYKNVFADLISNLNRINFAVEDSQGVWHHATISQ